MKVVTYLLLAIVAFFILNYLFSVVLGLLFWVVILGVFSGLLYLLYKATTKKKNYL